MFLLSFSDQNLSLLVINRVSDSWRMVRSESGHHDRSSHSGGAGTLIDPVTEVQGFPVGNPHFSVEVSVGLTKRSDDT